MEGVAFGVEAGEQLFVRHLLRVLIPALLSGYELGADPFDLLLGEGRRHQLLGGRREQEPEVVLEGASRDSGDLDACAEGEFCRDGLQLFPYRLPRALPSAS